MKATIGDTVIAEAADEDIVRIEGNAYFPPSALMTELYAESPTEYTCSWKGDAQYFHVVIDGATYDDAAWSYPEPYPSAFDRVGTDFSGYVAFGRPVQVS